LHLHVLREDAQKPVENPLVLGRDLDPKLQRMKAKRAGASNTLKLQCSLCCVIIRLQAREESAFLTATIPHRAAKQGETFMKPPSRELLRLKSRESYIPAVQYKDDSTRYAQARLSTLKVLLCQNHNPTCMTNATHHTGR
jgi:hypothetical protein